MTATAFGFSLHGRDGAARTGEITMPRGTIRTPAFMPVGTAATVKAMYADQVRDLGCSDPEPSGWPASEGCTPSCNGTGRSSPIRAASR